MSHIPLLKRVVEGKDALEKLRRVRLLKGRSMKLPDMARRRRWS